MSRHDSYRLKIPHVRAALRQLRWVTANHSSRVLVCLGFFSCGTEFLRCVPLSLLPKRDFFFFFSLWGWVKIIRVIGDPWPWMTGIAFCGKYILMYIPCSDRFDWQLVTTPRHWVELSTLHKLNFKGLVGLRRNGHYMYLQRSCGSDPPTPPIDAAKFIRYLYYGVLTCN